VPGQTPSRSAPSKRVKEKKVQKVSTKLSERERQRWKRAEKSQRLKILGKSLLIRIPLEVDVKGGGKPGESKIERQKKEIKGGFK